MPSTPSRARVTLTDVAEAAGVSLATASKVTNGRPDVAPATRSRVEAAITRLGYVSPTRRRSTDRPTIVFMVDQLDSPYAATVLSGARRAALQLDADLVVEPTHPTGSRSAPVTQTSLNHRLLSQGRTGAVVLTTSLDAQSMAQLSTARVPVVAIDPLDSSHQDITSVGATNWQGGYSAAEHLLQLGHTRLAVLTGPQASLSAAARLDGFLSACARHGLSLTEDVVARAPFARDSGYEVATQWLARGTDRPTAIATGCDLQAAGVLQAARDASLRVPQDLSVISYDDTLLTTLTTPPLTAVHQPLKEMGERAVQTVLLMADGGAPTAHHIEIATTLVVRASTAPPTVEAIGPAR